jgi:hypothetical protein
VVGRSIEGDWKICRRWLEDLEKLVGISGKMLEDLEKMVGRSRWLEDLEKVVGRSGEGVGRS